MINPNNLDGVASDDSGAQPINPITEENTILGENTTVPGSVNDPGAPSPTVPDSERENADSTITQGTPPYENEYFIRVNTPENDMPGKRLKNPLSYMASYTYQLSLYIITPDAYDAFLASGRRNINVFAEQIGSSAAAQEANRRGGAFLLAQGGGAGPDPRAPGVRYDYYIDNLSFRHITSSRGSTGSGAPTGNIEFKFQVTEPYGFSFINNIKLAQKTFDDYARNSQWGSDVDAVVTAPIAKQFFILGIRFYGWDQSGRQVLGTETFDGSTIDPAAAGNGALFETFYELTIHKIKYKIDGKATVYDLEGNVTGASLGSNVKKGVLNADISVSGNSVRDALSGPNGLFTKLNKDQQKLKDNGTVNFPMTYKVEWVGPAQEIAVASIVSDARRNRANEPGSNASNTEEVNDRTSTTSSPNNTQEEIGFTTGKPIIQVMDDIFSRSNYIESALAFNYTDSNEFDPETNSQPTELTPNKILRWYRITPTISNVKWDTKTRDWAYDITYVIETYLIPVMDNPFVVNTDKYYGPHKRYDYWYTGENREVLSYTQELNTQYYNEVPSGNPQTESSDDNTGNAQQTAINPNSSRTIDLSTAGGGLATAAAGSIKNVLYDPGSYTNAKIQIMGDPDFLMQEAGSGLNSLEQAYSRFYDKNFTIKPTGGQVFIEIDFKEAVDYSTSEFVDLVNGEGIRGAPGTLAINDSILFWDYPPGARDVIKGISYEVISVQSVFRNGAFTQNIDAIINDFGTGAASTEGGREGPTGGEVGLTQDEREVVDEAEGFAPDIPPGTAQPAAAGATATQPGTPNTGGRGVTANGAPLTNPLLQEATS